VRASMEVDAHVAGRDRDVSGHVDEVAEDLSRLRLSVAAPARGEEAGEPAGPSRADFPRPVSSRLRAHEALSVWSYWDLP
jgi:hypothetical protein